MIGASIEQGVAIEDELTAFRRVELEEEIDDLDDDDDYELVIELTPGDAPIVCFQARSHREFDGDPYCELGDGD